VVRGGGCLGGAGGVGSGSGRVGVTPIDAGDQGGSNGGSFNMVVAVLAEL
jgi:hypothetical protein